MTLDFDGVVGSELMAIVFVRHSTELTQESSVKLVEAHVCTMGAALEDVSAGYVQTKKLSRHRAEPLHSMTRLAHAHAHAPQASAFCMTARTAKINNADH